MSLLCEGLLGWQRAANDIKVCFERILNGPYWDRTRLVHCCINGCCNDREEAEAKALWGIMRVLLRTVPVTPLLSDWVRLGPNLDFFLAAEFQGILSTLLENAEWAMELPQQDVSGETVFIEWRKLAGSRYHRTRKVLACSEERFQRTLLAIAIEPLRHLHSLFLKFAHTAPNDQEWPNLLSEVWAPASRFIAVLQYFSTLVAGTCTRLRLIWQLEGCLTMSDWIDQHPQQARQARHLFLLLAGSVHRRYVATLDKYPFKLYAVADARRCDHGAIIDKFYKTLPCCLPPGTARELRQYVSSKDDFMQLLPQFRWFALLASFVTKLTIAGIERRHATHKQQANKGMPFGMFSAGSVLAECRLQSTATERLRQEQLKHLQEEGLVDKGSDTVSADRPASRRQKRVNPGGRLIRAQSAQELFKWDWLQSEKLLGRCWNPASKEAHAACKDAFASLPPEQKKALENRAQASKLEAAVNRKILDSRQSKDSSVKESHPSNNQPHGTAEGEAMHAGVAAAKTDANADALEIMIREDAQSHDAPPFPEHFACQSLLVPLEQQARSGVSAAVSKQKYPIKPEDISARAKVAGGIRGAIGKFAKEASTIAAGDMVPDKVLYPGCCGALCRMQSTQRTLKLHKGIVDNLFRVVQESGKPAHISQASILWVSEQYQAVEDVAGASAIKVTFFAIVHASGRQAHHAAQVTLAKLEPLCEPRGIQAAISMSGGILKLFFLLHQHLDQSSYCVILVLWSLFKLIAFQFLPKDLPQR